MRLPNKILIELSKRAKAKDKQKLLVGMVYNNLLPYQKRLLKKKSKYKAVLSSRRSAKSYTSCSYLIIVALTIANARCLYLGLTRASAKRVAWDHLISILDKFKIPYTRNKVELTISFSNGSVIEISGADSTTDAAEKYLGAAYDLIVIDEAGSFSPDVLDYLIDTVLNPTLIDRDGCLVLIGTPRPIESGRFYTVTTSSHPRWEVYIWKTEDNVYVKKQWEKEIRELKEANPDIEKEAWFKREYLGEWATDLTDLVYKFSSSNISTTSPTLNHYVLGVDIGWVDDCAFVLGGWRDNDNKLYIIKSFKKPEMLPEDIAKTIKHMSLPQTTVIADGANKTVIEELRRRYLIPIQAAKKSNKQDWIELINQDFLKRNIFINYDNDLLIDELKKLPWFITKGKREEHPAFANHLTDALLYLYRYAYNYLELPKKVLTEEERMYEEVKQRAQEKLVKPRWAR